MTAVAQGELFDFPTDDAALLRDSEFLAAVVRALTRNKAGDWRRVFSDRTTAGEEQPRNNQ